MLRWMFLHINVLSLFILSSQSLLCQLLTWTSIGVLSQVTVRLFMTFCKSLDIDYYCLHLLSRRNRLLASFLYNKHFRKSQFKSLPILGYKNDLFTLSCFWGLYQVSTETNVQWFLPSLFSKLNKLLLLGQQHLR